MDFYDMVGQILELLQRHGRVSYRALKRQFDLDDDYIEDLKEALLFAHPVVDEAGRGLVWTGEVGSPQPDARYGAEAEMRFHALLPAVTMLLQRDRRITYRTLKHIFGLDGALLDEIRKELTFRQLARDELGEGLVWIGETQPMTPSVVDVSSQRVTETRIPSPGPIGAAEVISKDTPQDEAIVSSEPVHSTPEAERRHLTVMFCDLADSTKLSQELDAEDLREVVRAYQTTAAEVVHQYEGHMAQYLGDGLLIYFGWPRAHEDDAQRALYSGLGIVEAITTTLNPRLEHEKGVQLTVRLGVHTGPVVVGEMGGGGRHEHLATGETVNIAARLEGLAQPNTVVISSTTARLVESGFVLEDVGTHTLKGVAEPTQVFRVLGPTEAYRDDEESLPDGGVFLVGRDEEIGLLLRRWEQSKEGLGQVVLMSGEAGIGKSSLVATVRTHVSEQGCTRITFRCSPYHTNSALYPVIAHLEQMLTFERDDTPDVKLDKLEHVVCTTNLSREEAVPLVAALLAIPLEGRYASLTLSPQQQRQQTLDTLVAWLVEEAEKRPVLAVWEDLHWADPSTLEMLGLVLEQTPTVPMLHILTFRPEFSPPWPTRSHMTPLTLNRLERLQVKSLITHLSGGKALPTEVVEHIVAKTDGVPLYVEELTKMLLASDLLQEQTDQYVLTGPLSTVAIPDTLQDSLMARLDQLNQAKEVAQLGAVLGREFAYELIQAISSQDEELLQANLTQLVEAELLYQRGRLPRARYIFKHALIQDAAYQSLLKTTRQHYHAQIARVLASRFPDTAEHQPELLGYHYTEAGLNEQAVGYWRQAGQRAVERSANLEAARHLYRGLELLKTRPETSERAHDELNFLIMLGPALIAAKGYTAPEVAQVYNRAYELCHRVGEAEQRFSVLTGLRRFYHVRGDFATARDIGEQLLTMATDQHDPTLLLEAYWSLSGVLFHLGEFTLVQQHLNQAVAIYESQRDGAQTVRHGTIPGIHCLSWLSLTLWMLGYPEQALQRSHQACTLARQHTSPFALDVVLVQAAALHQYRREWPLAQKHVESSDALRSVQGDLRHERMTFLRGWVLAMQGKGEQGITFLCQYLDGAVSGQLRPHALLLLADAYGKLDQIEAGLKALAEGFALVEKLGTYCYESEMHRLKGELLLSQASDNQADAETCFQKAISIAQHQSAKSWELRAATSLAMLWKSQGKRQDAYDLLAPVYGWFTEGFDTADLQAAKVLLTKLDV